MLSVSDIVNRAKEIDDGVAVFANGLSFNLCKGDSGYVLSTDSSTFKIKPTKKHEKISISKGEDSLFAYDALNLRYPKPRYEFYRLSSTEHVSLYDTAVFSFKIGDPPFEYKCEYSFTIENEICLDVKFQVIDDQVYAIFKTSEPLEVDRLIGLTLRYRYCLAFIYSKIDSSSFVILCNQNDEFLISHGARVSVKHSFSVFSKPHEFDFLDNDQTVMSNYTPHADDEFVRKFINTVMMETCLYNVILLLAEEAKRTTYSLTVNAFVSLEMLATKYVQKTKLSKNMKKEIKKIKDVFVETLKDEIESNAISEMAFDHIEKKLRSLSQPMNADKLAALFEQYGIPVRDVENRILKLRNLYLHGVLKEDDEKELEDFKVYLASYRMASCLILKICGYAGSIFVIDKVIPCYEQCSMGEAFERI